jgi:3-methyl-2-oxobutanoate hydroxymethyltransferase
MARDKITITQLQGKKPLGKRISMLTAYDYPTALLADRAGIDMVLVGDSLAMVVMGLETTVPITMEEMLHHVRAVSRGAGGTHIVGDLPFLSYHTSIREAIWNAGRLLKEGGADSVKLEGGAEMADVVRAIVRAGIPVMGHIGLTPQTVSKLGGFKTQGREAGAARQLVDDGRALEGAGAYALVLEAIPAPVARYITETLRIPTIGIGAGPYCDGQVLVTHDMLGLFDRFVPRFVKQYAQVGQIMLEAFERYRREVEEGRFPGAEHCFSMPEEEERRFLAEIDRPGMP